MSKEIKTKLLAIYCGLIWMHIAFAVSKGDYDNPFRVLVMALEIATCIVLAIDIGSVRGKSHS